MRIRVLETELRVDMVQKVEDATIGVDIQLISHKDTTIGYESSGDNKLDIRL